MDTHINFQSEAYQKHCHWLKAYTAWITQKISICSDMLNKGYTYKLRRLLEIVDKEAELTKTLSDYYKELAAKSQ